MPAITRAKARAGESAGGSSSNPPPAGWLTSMPSAWLRQLALRLDAGSVLRLFQTCTIMRDLVLVERPTFVNVDVPSPGQEDADTAKAASHAKLLLANKLSSLVKLKLSSADTGATRELLSGVMATTGHALQGVIHVTLENHRTLDSVAPAWLATACPNMTSLQLVWCEFAGLPAPGASIPTCSQLRHLAIGRRRGTHLTQAQLQLQLSALPGLTSLSVESWFSPEGSSVVAAQLTQLTLGYYDQSLVPQLSDWFPNLRELRLPERVIQDADMEVLLSMQQQHHQHHQHQHHQHHQHQQLAVFECKGFRLEHSYAQRPCPWMHLGFKVLDVTAFDRLPWEGALSMSCTLFQGPHNADDAITMPPSRNVWAMSIVASGDEGAAGRVAAAVTRLGGFRCDAAQTEKQAGVQLLPVLPLVAACKPKCFQVSEARVTLRLLAGIHEHMAGSFLRCITFKRCYWAQGVLARMLPGLPASLEWFCLENELQHLSEAQLRALCVHACRPVNLKVEFLVNVWREDWPRGWEGRLRAAMAKAGHQHIKTLDGEFGDLGPPDDYWLFRGEGEEGSADEVSERGSADSDWESDDNEVPWPNPHK